jgi:hypothetical protein
MSCKKRDINEICLEPISDKDVKWLSTHWADVCELITTKPKISY